MTGILYIRQRVNNEKPILEPEAFNRMLEEAEPELKGFFDQLYKGTNPGSKSNMTNEKNKKRLVLFCYFLAGLNNKFVSGVKAEIGYLLMVQVHPHHQSKHLQEQALALDVRL